ncbi:MAG: PRC-barrel domain containing protein [Pedobacter sp.]|nr:MAG: PRC-barrel domain containing protein [Pedobacter sp.]
MQENTYRTLETLSDSNYQIVDGEPDITGWKVKSESNTYLGEVKDLLFDPETRAVRYLIIDLKNNGMNLGEKKVMIPIGIAHLHTNEDKVILPNVHIDQFNALPDYSTSELGPETEMNIRSVIGSPAALRMEESITAFDQKAFYAHQHFNKDQFYQRSDRSTEEKTIHDMIDRSNSYDRHGAEPETGSGTYYNTDQDNGNIDNPNDPANGSRDAHNSDQTNMEDNNRSGY